MHTPSDQPRIGVVHGRFQGLHRGHAEYLVAARERCDRLIVGITAPNRHTASSNAGDSHRSQREHNPFTFYERLCMVEACLTEAFAIAIDDCDGVFLSVDIDVCDPGHAPGTGTPEPGGLTARQLLDSVRRIAYELPVVGIDVVEVSPPYDHADITSFLANRVVLEALSGIARRRRDKRDGTTWDPSRPLLSDR